jgi:hypothetical protein
MRYIVFAVLIGRATISLAFAWSAGDPRRKGETVRAFADDEPDRGSASPSQSRKR